MEENKTGVWVRTKNGQELKYNSRMMKLFDVGDIVEVDNDDVYAKFKIEIVELKNASRIVATYTIKPQCKIIRTTHPWRYAVLHDAEPIEIRCWLLFHHCIKKNSIEISAYNQQKRVLL